jgi:membrane protein implicated in regulation of membrane protease activity
MTMIRAIKKTVQAFWMLAGLVMLFVWIAFGGWLLLWIGSSAIGATWAPAIGSWGYDFLVQHFWVKLVAILAFLTFLGAISGETTRRRHSRPDSNLEAEREKEEERRMQVEQSLVSRRNQAAFHR